MLDIPEAKFAILIVFLATLIHVDLWSLGEKKLETAGKNSIKVIRHVFCFGIEFLENKDIGIFGHFIVNDFIKQYSYHTYF